MEEATVTQVENVEQEVGEQNSPMYQQGRFPSVIDTDDLVFELGKQIVDKINKEKLLENVLKKAKVLEVGAIEVKKLQVEAERKTIELKNSNTLYEENNRKLDKELVSVRNELESQKTETDNKEVENVRFNEALIGMRAELKNKNIENVRFKQEQLKLEESLEVEKKLNKKLNKELDEASDKLGEQKRICKENEEKLNEEIGTLKNSLGGPKNKKKNSKS